MRTDHTPIPTTDISPAPVAAVAADTAGDGQTLSALQRLYGILDDLRGHLGGFSHLRDGLPAALGHHRGVYVFFEPAEDRTGSGRGPRVVRIGTHGPAAGSRSTLRSRLANHRGSTAGGNQRTSIFRRHVGAALMAAGRVPTIPGWHQGSSAPAAQRDAEREVEILVSQHIGAMPFLWLPIEDEAGPDSERGLIERNAIALLSSPAANRLDPPSPTWLGRYAPALAVQESGLWNVRHVGEGHDPAFLHRLAQLVAEVR